MDLMSFNSIPDFHNEKCKSVKDHDILSFSFSLHMKMPTKILSSVILPMQSILMAFKHLLFFACIPLHTSIWEKYSDTRGKKSIIAMALWYTLFWYLFPAYYTWPVCTTFIILLTEIHDTCHENPCISHHYTRWDPEPIHCARDSNISFTSQFYWYQSTAIN